MNTVRLTAAQAMMRWLSVQMTEDGERFIDGVWAIFGHGNVAGIGEALHGIGDALLTWRGQNEQTMCHAAIAYAKTKRRRRAMAVTSSIGPGATNMVTAAALAHVNRLPLLLIPGDVFANRRPDPVLVIGVGTRFQDFTTGSWTVFSNPGRRLLSINLHPYDAVKHGALPVMGDARVTLERLSAALGDRRFDAPDFKARTDWHETVHTVTASPNEAGLPSDAQVIGAVQRVAEENTLVMCAAGTMPGALQVLWQAQAGGYHMEYGYSCMGYEVAGAMGIKLAAPEKDVVCFVGDGSYMMANSELATAVMMRVPFTIILTDNRGYGCINRLQIGCGGAEFNNMYENSNIEVQPEIDFVAHAASMGANADKASGIGDLEAKIIAARDRDVPTVIVIDTTAVQGTGAGGHWWDVAVPQTGGPSRLEKAREHYQSMKAKQHIVN